MMMNGFKICASCKALKPHGEFHKDRRQCDGLNRICKQCRKEKYINSQNRKVYSKKFGEVETWDQVESVIRELAEIEADNEDYLELLKRKTAIIKNDYEEATANGRAHGIGLRILLKNFLNNQLHKKKTITKVSRFGTVIYDGSNLTFKLNTKLARQCRGKP